MGEVCIYLTNTIQKSFILLLRKVNVNSDTTIFTLSFMATRCNKIPFSGFNLNTPSLLVHPLRRMKSVLILSLSVLLFSCKTRESLIYYDEIGECYPTTENIDKMYQKRIETGENYVWFNCKWVTPSQRDSLSLIENTSIFEKLILINDSTNK